MHRTIFIVGVFWVCSFGSSVLGFTIDHVRYSPANSTSCVDKCNQGNIPGAPCQCNSACVTFGDCCEDYLETCVGTCEAKCGEHYSPANVCQCNNNCLEHGDCCRDFSEFCGISNAIIEALAEELISLDENNVALLVSVSPTTDPLIRYSDDIFLKPTIATLVPLHDNYYPDVLLTEDVTQEELDEETEFLDLVFETQVIRRAQAFLQDNDFDSSRENLYKLFFGIYNRGQGKFGSSGFEHIFLGEIMNGFC